MSLLVYVMEENSREDVMTPESREVLFRVAQWVAGRKRLIVRKVRQLAETEENYLFIIREIDRVKSQIERARMLQAEATLTLIDWLTILELFDWKCAYCLEKPFQVMSHVIPLPSGGTTPENCVPACYSCSSGRREVKRTERDRLQASLREAKHRRWHEESVSASPT
jgi:5-methylcytosine-specific restriction endonuclease McrA